MSISRRRKAFKTPGAAIISAYVALVTLLGGCVSSDYTDAPAGPLHEMKAEWEHESGARTTIALDAPEEVMDREGSLRLAYPLTILNGNLMEKYYLDGELRIGRADFVEDDGLLINRRWQSYVGLPPPLGIGLSHMIKEEGKLHYSGLWGEIVLPHQYQVDGRVETATVNLEGAPYSVKEILRHSSFKYVDGRLVPERPGWKLLNYEVGEELPSIPRWPPMLDAPARGAANDHVLFPNEENDFFKVGFSAAELMTELAHRSSNAKAYLEHGCFIYYGLSGPLHEANSAENILPWPVVLNESKKREYTASFEILNQQGLLGRFGLEVQVNEEGEKSYTLAQEELGSAYRYTCSDVEAMPATLVPPERFLSMLSSDARNGAFWFRFSAVPTSADIAIPRGGGEYLLAWMPREGGEFGVTPIAAVHGVTGDWFRLQTEHDP